MKRVLCIIVSIILCSCSRPPFEKHQSIHLYVDNGYIYSDNSAFLLIEEEQLRELINDRWGAELYIKNRKILNRIIGLQLTLDGYKPPEQNNLSSSVGWCQPRRLSH